MAYVDGEPCGFQVLVLFEAPVALRTPPGLREVVAGHAALQAAPDPAKRLHLVGIVDPRGDMPVERHPGGLVHAPVHDDFRAWCVLPDRHLHLPRGVAEALPERLFAALAVSFPLLEIRDGRRDKADHAGREAVTGKELPVGELAQ